MTNREKMDLRFRVFLMNLLDRRELTFSQIRGCVARDYHEKEYQRQEIRVFLVLLQGNNLITKSIIEPEDRDDSCKYHYLLTEKGRARKRLYQERMRNGEGIVA